MHDDSHGYTDKKNSARYFTTHRSITWVLAALVCLWGAYAYWKMPKRKDPDIPVRAAAVVASWPGASTEKVEALLARPIENKLAENAHVDRIESTVRTGTAIVVVTLDQKVVDTAKAFDDMWLKLDTLKSLPEGSRLDFIKDFGDTVTLMLTVASPSLGDVDRQLRAEGLRRSLATARAGAPGPRAALLASFPASLRMNELRKVLPLLQVALAARGASDFRAVEAPGMLGLDFRTTLTDAELKAFAADFGRDRLHRGERHPDARGPILVRDPAGIEAALAAIGGDKYSLRELDQMTEEIQRRLRRVSSVSKVDRSGVVPERVWLTYSQEKLASYGVAPAALAQALKSHNITTPGGAFDLDDKTVRVDASGEFASEAEIGDVPVPTGNGASLHIRDLVEVNRDYERPARYANMLTHRQADGSWHTARAITLGVSMRAGGQIGQFAREVDAALAEVKTRLPEDLVVARTSDQPRQVDENVDLFMSSLYEAIAIVVLVAFVGFWEWRSAVLLSVSIPLTLLMTFGIIHVLGIDIQQISIASLIIALGLLVDDPVVAGDAIKVELTNGQPRQTAAWLGPTKLAKAIMFATLTNMVAYLPFLSLPEDAGRFIYSLPIVMTAALVASRIVSMWFIPMFGYYLLRAPSRPRPAGIPTRGVLALYARAASWAIDHRWKVLGAALVLLVAGGLGVRSLKQSFFPKDLQYLFYVDVWLPEDAPISATGAAADQAAQIIRETSGAWAKQHPPEAHGKRDAAGHAPGQPEAIESVTAFIGGGGPRFWFSVAPEQRQTNYAQLVVQMKDKHQTSQFVVPLQRALSARVPGARIDVRLLEAGPPVGVPISIRLAGEDIGVLRAQAEKVTRLLTGIPVIERVRDNWGAEMLSLRLEVDGDRAARAGLTNHDVASSSSAALNGAMVGQLRDGDDTIPIVARLVGTERQSVTDLQNLYVHSNAGRRAPLRQLSTLSYGSASERVVRRNHLRTITVSGFPVAGVLPSEVLEKAMPGIEAVQKQLPPGYTLEIGGEREEQVKGFRNLAVVLLISVVAIFVALVFQFKSAIKPVIVFAAIPFGVMGALVSLRVMGTPFGFMAFLGVISLIGVIVSHVIVLFDFIEEKHEEGEPLRQALVEAGIARLRPVAITVAATVLGLIPLALHGGPLWEPLCYAQIGGLTIATCVTLLLVPVLYAVFVLDLKWVKWTTKAQVPAGAPSGEARALAA
jgi:multidrug efflux pump subunit AcrB